MNNKAHEVSGRAFIIKSDALVIEAILNDHLVGTAREIVAERLDAIIGNAQQIRILIHGEKL